MARKSIRKIIEDYTTETGSVLFLLLCSIVTYLRGLITLTIFFTVSFILSTAGLIIAYSRKNYLEK